LLRPQPLPVARWSAIGDGRPLDRTAAVVGCGQSSDRSNCGSGVASTSRTITGSRRAWRRCPSACRSRWCVRRPRSSYSRAKPTTLARCLPRHYARTEDEGHALVRECSSTARRNTAQRERPWPLDRSPDPPGGGQHTESWSLMTKPGSRSLCNSLTASGTRRAKSGRRPATHGEDGAQRSTIYIWHSDCVSLQQVGIRRQSSHPEMLGGQDLNRLRAEPKGDR